MTTLVEFDGFYSAARARQIAMGQSSASNIILAEISLLQGLVDAAAAVGLLNVINSNTPMTLSAAYFNSWNDPFNYATAADELNRAQMAQVVNYFSRLGYYIRRQRVGVTNFFAWNISW